MSAIVDLINQSVPTLITQDGKLVYSDASNKLFIRTQRAGIKEVGITKEEDPIFTAWLAGPPNITEFTNDAGYLSIVSVDGVTITGDGTPGNPLVASGSSVTPAALTKTDDTNVTLTLGGSPSTSLLQGVSLTLGWTGTLADSRIASAATWNGKQNALGFTPEDVSNKSTTTTLGTSDTLYPTQNAVKTYVDTAISGVQIDLLQVQVFS